MKDLGILSIPTEGLSADDANSAIAAFAASLLIVSMASLPFTAAELLVEFGATGEFPKDLHKIVASNLLRSPQ